MSAFNEFISDMTHRMFCRHMDGFTLLCGPGIIDFSK